MRKSFRLTLSPIVRCAFVAPVALLSVAGTALAVPSIVDRIPADAAIAVAIPSVENLEKDIRSIATLFGMPAGSINLDALLEQVGMSGVVAKTGPAAFFIIMPAEGAGEPTQGAMFTTVDFDAIVKSIGGKAENGMITAEINGTPAYLKKLDGGFVFISPSEAFTKKFEGKPGSAAGFTSMIGPMGDKASEKSDLSIIINFDKVRPFYEMGLDQFAAQLESTPIPEEQIEQISKMIEHVGGTYGKDAKAIVATLNIDTAGVSLDWITRFNDDSKLAEVAATPGNAGALFNRVPALPFLATFAADFGNPGVQKLLAMVPDLSPVKPVIDAAKGEKAATPAAEKLAAAKPMIDAAAMRKMLEITDGSVTVVGVSPAGIMGGLLTRSVSFVTTKNPTEYIRLNRAALQQMQDSDTAEVTFTEAGAEVAGKKVDVFEVRLKPDGDNPMAGKVMAGLYGLSGGPNGFIAGVDGGVISTFAKSSELMEKSMKAAAGTDTMGADKTMAATAKNLPVGRVAEAYIGVKGIIDSVSGFIAMSNPNFKLDMPENLPPLALSIATGGGSLQATIFAPSPTLKVLGDVAKQFKNNGGDDEADDAPAGKKPAKGSDRGGDEGDKPADKDAEKSVKPKF